MALRLRYKTHFKKKRMDDFLLCKVVQRLLVDADPSLPPFFPPSLPPQSGFHKPAQHVGSQSSVGCFLSTQTRTTAHSLHRRIQTGLSLPLTHTHFPCSLHAVGVICIAWLSQWETLPHPALKAGSRKGRASEEGEGPFSVCRTRTEY